MLAMMSMLDGLEYLVYFFLFWAVALLLTTGTAVWMVGRAIESCQEVIYKRTDGRYATWQQYAVPLVIILTLDGAYLMYVRAAIFEGSFLGVFVFFSLFPIATFLIPYLATREFFKCTELPVRVVCWTTMIVHALTGGFVLNRLASL